MEENRCWPEAAERQTIERVSLNVTFRTDWNRPADPSASGSRVPSRHGRFHPTVRHQPEQCHSGKFPDSDPRCDEPRRRRAEPAQHERDLAFEVFAELASQRAVLTMV